MNKLPELYTVSFDKKIDNSLDFIKIHKNIDNKYVNIRKKIDNIFKSSNYIYKIKVKIILKDKILEEYIVGINSNKLLTIDNKAILISDIIDINEF